MRKVDDAWLDDIERRYPGLLKTIAYYEAVELPCARCGSKHTAQVTTGVIGRTIHLAAATDKVKLIPNGHPGDLFCWSCGDSFTDDTARK